MFFDGDLDMLARARVLRFGKDAPARAAERGAEYPADADGSRIFWKRIELARRCSAKNLATLQNRS